MIDFAYSRLNLRFNPFGELDRQQRIENAIPRCNLDSIGRFLENSSPMRRRAVQFIGAAGSGKSTHMLLLANRIKGFQYIHLPLDSKRHIPARANLMIDEAQRLGWRQRNSLFRNADRIVLGTHCCFETRLRSRGFDVKTVSLDKPPGLDWLVTALNLKIETARRRVDTQNPPQISRATVINLIHEFGNNIRGMERRLYDTFHQLNLEIEPDRHLIPLEQVVVEQGSHGHIGTENRPR